MAPKKTPPPFDPDKLVREMPGAYRTADGRFAVRSDPGGAWYVADTERANEFGLELIIGPLRTLDEARTALRAQREQGTGAEAGGRIELDAATELPREPEPALEAEPVHEPAPAAEPESVAEPAPGPEPPIQPEPPAPRPAVRVRRARRRRTGDERDLVADALRRINDAWVTGHAADMADDLDERVVMVQPGFAGRVKGREAAIDSYSDFTESAVIHGYAESDLVIDTFDETAVATYRYDIDWEMDGERHVEAGHDFFVFRRHGGRWIAAWRLLTVQPPEVGA
jgi:hypothetical protein